MASAMTSQQPRWGSWLSFLGETVPRAIRKSRQKAIGHTKTHAQREVTQHGDSIVGTLHTNGVCVTVE